MKFWDSVEKLFRQVSVVSNQEFAAEGELFVPPETLSVTAGFWREYKCTFGCGGCCLAFSLDWLPEEWSNLCSHYPHVQDMGESRCVNVNGVDKVIMSIIQDRADVWCKLFDGKGCTIHEHNPLSCRIELIKFKRQGDKGYITKTPFGRAWKMRSYSGDPIMCELTHFSDEQFLHNDMPILEQMLRWCQYLGIGTLLPDVIEKLKGANINGVRSKVVIRDGSLTGMLF